MAGRAIFSVVVMRVDDPEWGQSLFVEGHGSGGVAYRYKDMIEHCALLVQMM
jgi:hypothetical protein